MPVMIMHIPISITIRNVHWRCSTITAMDAVNSRNALHMIRAGSPISAVIILISNTAEMLINTANINALALDFLICIIYNLKDLQFKKRKEVALATSYSLKLVGDFKSFELAFQLFNFKF
jgi:hypothetical protein